MTFFKDTSGNIYELSVEDMTRGGVAFLPANCEEISDAEADALRAAKLPVPTEADYSNAIQAMMDAKARERQYDGIQSAITYRGDGNARFAVEAEALFAWRSAVWTYATAQLAAVMAGSRTQPTVADFVDEVQTNCPFSWPVTA